MTEIPSELTKAIQALWRNPPPKSNNIFEWPDFRELINVCIQLFPDASGSIGSAGHPDIQGVGLALEHAFRSIGAPWIAEKGIASFPPAPERVSAAILEAFVATEVKLVHLCPMDQADDWPPLRFGPCEVRKFTSDELSLVFQPARLRRHFHSYSFDASSFSKFTWLKIPEMRSLTKPVGSRAIPIFYQGWDEPFGTIEPHSRAWPNIVERALFALLLLPWEEMTEHASFEWRGFRVPWCHTINPDIFSQLSLPPHADSLSWEPDIFDHPITGESIELERPAALDLVPGAKSQFASLDDQRWRNIETAVASNLFNPLVVHFLTRAFASRGIDEFIGHIIAVEAALGMARDHDRSVRSKINGKNPGATERVARRVAGLAGPAHSEQEFKNLFKLRSDFVHGNNLGSISPQDRIAARKLARDVADKLVGATASSPNMGREQYLERLCP